MERFKSGSTPLLRPVSSATQTFDTRKEEWPLDEPMPAIDATYKVYFKISCFIFLWFSNHSARN